MCINWKKYDYQTEIEINEGALDIEWRDQPALVTKYNEAKADAQKELDLAKERLDFLLAEKDRDYRLQFSGSGEKVTENSIKAAIDRDMDVQGLKQALIEAKHTLALMQAACIGFDHRKAVLENLVRLFGMQYYAEPQAKLEDRVAMDAASENAVQNRIKQAMSHGKPRRKN